MRAIFLTFLVGCSWSTFDDLGNQTWAHSQDKPNVGSSDYGVTIAGASSGTSGGLLAVLGNDSPSYSTLVYDASGGSSLGPNPQSLGQHFISSLGEQPILVSDGNGKIALVEKAIDAGQIAVFTGPAGTPADMPFPSVAPPDAATFTPGSVLLVAASAAAGTANLFVLDGVSAVKSCQLNDDAGASLSAAAIAADTTTLWAWTKMGKLDGYPLTALQGCTGVLAPTRSGFATTGFSPGIGAQLHLVATATTSYAILSAHADKATNGQAFVVDLTPATPVAVGSALSVDGLVSSTVGVFSSMTYIAFGFPNRTNNGVTSGQVEIHAFDPATGVMTAEPAELLADAQPDSNQLFGRSVTTMMMNGKPILVVAASNEIIAYDETSLYPDVRPAVR